MKPDILIVDDQPENLHLLSSILSKQGYRVRNAVSGKRMFIAMQQKLPDLVLLDIKLPDTDGYTLCEQLKQYQRTQDIPVIFISALSDVFDKVRAFDSGGVDYIPKPLQVEEVVSRVSTQIQLSQQKAQLQAQNEQLNQEIQQRQQAEEALEVVLHAVSHDLRSPVLGIAVFLKSLLADDKQSIIPVEATMLNRMQEACQRQLHLIKSLETVKATGGHLALFKSRLVSLPSILDQLLQQWQERLRQQDITLDCHISDSLPEVEVDPHQMMRVFDNLIANAVKHNGAGIALTLTLEEEANGVRCVVADNGRGIPSEYADTLFDCYARVNDAPKPGLGLGLYICREIVKAHGGQIGVESQEGQGTQFWFTIPF